MPHGLVFNDDVRVAAWAFQAYRVHPYLVNKAMGIVKHPEGTLVGACTFENFNGYNVDLSYYGHRTLTVGIVRVIAQVCLQAFNPARATMITSKRNKHLIRSLQKIGFRIEGVQRCMYGCDDSQRSTGVRLVMFREQIEKLACPSPPYLDKTQQQ
jgi:hypothetical protein